VLDPRRLATLKAVVAAGSFAGAADRLSYTQAAVSQHITELERAVGLRLLDRRPVRPTEAGLLALAAADGVEDALAVAETALRALRDGETGALRIAAFGSAVSDLLALALAQYGRLHPDVEMTLTSVEPPAAHQGLVAGRFDVAVTFDYDIDPADPPAPVVREPLLDDPVLVALPAGHPLASRGSIRLDRLATEPWIAAPLAGLPLAALRKATGRGFAPQVRYEGEDFAAVLALVAAELGVALVPRLATSRAPAGVALRPLAGATMIRRLYTARLRASSPRTAGAFSDVLRTVAGEHPATPDERGRSAQRT